MRSPVTTALLAVCLRFLGPNDEMDHAVGRRDEETVAFYRDTLGLPLIEEEKNGCIFQLGPNRLWIDSVPNLSHPDIWLELETNDTEAAASFLKVHGVTRRDEVEQLREDFNGFFISAPNGMIHLVIGPEEA